ncbi:MAG: hypothetical protein IT306_10745 [Chloroflexi bacterium]|nr:hypothetical protein [Chloroflexota bacterium]
MTAGRPPADRRWHTVSLGLLLAIYLGLYGWFVFSTDRLPYVYDNTETFSALWHAHNLYTFDFFTSWGLTDEAYGPEPAAHPFVHSHQGNFPRLFAYLIYALGARTAESQIVVTTFTIGIAAVVFAFEFLARRAGPRFALLACLLLLTDYLFFAQWQVVTYRVWHVFFVFSSLLCVDGLGGNRSRRWAVLTFLNFLALFYFELIFVAYVALFTAFSAGWWYRWAWRTALRFWALQAAGGGLALAILMLQGALFLGPRVFAEDLYLTYFARNLAADSPAMLERLDTFFRQHPIVFWFNIIDVRGLRGPGAFFGQLATWHFEALTPFLTLLLGTVWLGWLLGSVRWPSPLVRGGRQAAGSAWLLRDRWRTPLGLVRLSLRFEMPLTWPAWAECRRTAAPRATLVLVLLGVPTLLLAVTLLRDQAVLGLPQSQASFLRQTRGLGYAGLLVAGVVALGLLWGTLPRWQLLARIALGRAVLAAGLLLAVNAFVRGQSALYNQQAAPLWQGYLGLGLPHGAVVALLLAAAGLAAALVLFGSRPLLGGDRASHLGGLLSFVVLGDVALYATYVLSPGYVISGYLSRGAPLFVFAVDVALAIGLSVAVQAGCRALAGAAGLLRHHLGPPDLGRRRLPASVTLGLLGVALIGLGGVSVVAWGKVQLGYLTLLPPTHFAFLKTLAEPPYLGQSFVGNRYMAPPAAYTGQWAYIDATIGQARIELTDDGYRVAQELQTYVWLRDRATNSAYREPRYYLCTRYQSLADALIRAQDLRGYGGSCNDLPLVRRADSAEQPYLQYRVTARDPSPAGSWAIVELDWVYPPYLKPAPGAAGASRVLVTPRQTAGGLSLDVTYRYAHQKETPEAGTMLRLYLREPSGVSCLLREQAAPGPLVVPDGVAGTLFVTVQPSTTEKRGPAYQSDLLQVDGGGRGCS